MSEANKVNEDNKTIVDKVKANGETATASSTPSKGKSINDIIDNNEKGVASGTKLIRNFTYELHDVDDIFTSKMSFFLEELNKQLNALVNSNIYTENKENLDKVLKSKGEFRKELLRLLKTEYKDFYQKYYFETQIFGNKAKYFRTVIEEYRRILLSRLHRQTIIDMIVKNPTITYQEVFNKLCELNEQRSGSDYKFNWISKAEFNNIIKQLKNSTSSESSEAKAAKAKLTTTIDNLLSVSEADEAQTIDTYAIDYSSEDNQISEFNFTDNDEYYLIEFKLKYSDYTTQSDSLLTYSCKVPKKQIKGLTTGYTKLKKFTRPRIFLNNNKLYISFNYELLVNHQQSDSNSEQATWQFKTMGIDIGVAKSATAAIISAHMCWAASQLDERPASSGEATTAIEQPVKQAIIDLTQPVAISSNELTISDKTQFVSKHIEILKNEQNYIYKKEQAIAALLKLKQSDGNANFAEKLASVSYTADELVNLAAKLGNDVDLLYKYQRLNKLRLHLRHKVSNLKKELSFLTARDMISHAIDNKVDLITIEKLSWIQDEHHTTWDYNQIQQRIIHEANIYGIKVKKVSCAYSSKHNPLTLAKEEVDQNRKLVKCLFDRDYAAAIILARRGIKLGKKKLRQVSQPSSSPASHINDSFHAVNLSLKSSLQPSLQYRQLKLCEQKSIISERSVRCYANEVNFAYFTDYSIL